MLRVAIIGAGHMGRLHAQKLAALSEVRLVGIADPDESRGRALAEQHACAFFPGYQSVIREKADAAVVAAPTDRHHEIARACLEAGLHVLVEKPLAQSLREAAKRTSRPLPASISDSVLAKKQAVSQVRAAQ